jgi:hypothetical protein
MTATPQDAIQSWLHKDCYFYASMNVSKATFSKKVHNMLTIVPKWLDTIFKQFIVGKPQLPNVGCVTYANKVKGKVKINDMISLFL